MALVQEILLQLPKYDSMARKAQLGDVIFISNGIVRSLLTILNNIYILSGQIRFCEPKLVH